MTKSEGRMPKGMDGERGVSEAEDVRVIETDPDLHCASVRLGAKDGGAGIAWDVVIIDRFPR